MKKTIVKVIRGDEWTCDRCAPSEGQPYCYPPHPDVRCDCCGNPLTPDERLVVIQREILSEVQRLTDAVVSRTMSQPDEETVVSTASLLMIKEVAVLLRCSVKAVYAKLARGQIPGATKIGRRRYVRRTELLKWLEERVPSPGGNRR